VTGLPVPAARCSASIADGQIYVGIGDIFGAGASGPGAITALGL
jgi:hypothetical protein